MDLIVICGQDVFLHTLTLTKSFKRDINFSVMGGLFTLTGSSQEVLKQEDEDAICFSFNMFTVSVALYFNQVSV